MGDGGGGQWLVRMEWCPAGWSVCLPLLVFPCTINFRSSILAAAHPGGPGKRAVKWLWCGGGGYMILMCTVQWDNVHFDLLAGITYDTCFVRTNR